jgi:DNA-binding transcriptional LysR family regulator
MAMTFEELRAFAHVAELGGVSAAARALGLPKSRVSRLLADLEADLAIRLAHRSTRGLALTDEGRAFLGHARRVLAEWEQARESVAPGGGAARGAIRVTAPYSLGARLIGPLLPAFLERHPDVRVDLQLTSRHVDLVEEGFDLAVRIAPPPSSTLWRRRLASNPIRLCASPAYLARAGDVEAPERLAAHALLVIAHRPGEVRLEFARGAESVRIAVTPRLACNDPTALIEAALAGVGVAETPLIVGRRYLETGELVVVLPDWRLPEAEICALFPPGRAMAPRVRVFVDFLVEALTPTLAKAGDVKV